MRYHRRHMVGRHGVYLYLHRLNLRALTTKNKNKNDATLWRTFAHMGKQPPPPRPYVRMREWTKLCMGKSLLEPAERKRARVFASHARCTYEEHCRQAIIQHPLLTAVAAAFAETNQPRQNKTHTILDSSSICTHLLATEARRVHRCQSLVQREPAIPVGLPGLEELRRRHRKLDLRQATARERAKGMCRRDR